MSAKVVEVQFYTNRLKFYYTTNSDSAHFRTRVGVGNKHAYTERNWRTYRPDTSNSWTYQSISYATSTATTP